MEIILTDSRGSQFCKVATFEQANTAAKAVIKRRRWSDLYYKITFDEGTETEGSIDLEPRTFHQPHLSHIITNHLKTWWTNVSNSKASYLPEDYKQFCKRLLTLSNL